jgi:hypothetical protein
MFKRYPHVFVPNIAGLSSAGYEHTCESILEAGFICGYSLLLETIVIGNVKRCGFTRLTDIGHSRIPELFQEPTRLLEILTKLETMEEPRTGEKNCDWKTRPLLMRCSAFAAMAKAGFVFDRLLANSFGNVSEREAHAIYLRAIHDADLQAALCTNTECWTEKYLKRCVSLPLDTRSNLSTLKQWSSDNLPSHSESDIKQSSWFHRISAAL